MHIHVERILISLLNTGVETLASAFSVVGICIHINICIWRGIALFIPMLFFFRSYTHAGSGAEEGPVIEKKTKGSAKWA